MSTRLSRRAVRRLRRHGLFLGALLALVIMIVLAFAVAPRNDDAPRLRVPTAVDG